jgi:hypothetical protein
MLDLYGALAEDLYRSDVTPDITEHIGRIIIENYGITADIAEERWGRDEMHDALAPFRRAEIETALLSLRGIAPGRVQVDSVSNAMRNAYHREVYVGRVAITQSKVDAPHGPIREARFRVTLAMRSQQSFDLLGDEPEPRPDALLWASFVHMPSDRPDLPAFIRVAFPFPDGSWEHSVDLYALVPSLGGYAESQTLIQLRQELRRRRTG